MVERLREDEDDGGQGDGDVACCGDDELFLQAASVGHKRQNILDAYGKGILGDGK